MEKESTAVHTTPCKAFACFQQSQTLKMLNFLQVSQKKIIYKGLTEQQGRRHKDFTFQSISFLSEKLRHTHTPIVQETVKSLLAGKNTTILILGNDEAKKQKILIGQSQNQGILLQILAFLFETCYQQELDDRVTVKLSCWEHRQGKIGDLLGGTGLKSTLCNWISHDLIQGNVLVGIPEIIIRNMKTALKVIRIFMKSLQQNRQHNEQTQNLTFTLKLQIDNSFDKQGNTSEYLVSKLHIVKLALPYNIRTPSKHASWFITLFNYMQGQVLDKTHRPEQIPITDQFSIYLRDTMIRGVSALYCLTVFTNKMNANDCLTALKFSAYFQQLRLNPITCTINLPQLMMQKMTLENEIVKLLAQQRAWTKTVRTWLVHQQATFWLDLQLITNMHYHLMQAHNMLQYEYANVLTIGCDRLERYIFNQEVEDYFYAKKVTLEPSQQLQNALARYLEMRKQQQELHTKLCKKLGAVIVKLKKETNQNKEEKYILNSRIKQKQTMEKLLQLYSTLSAHFLYENQHPFPKQIHPASAAAAEQPPAAIPSTIQQIIQKVQQRQPEPGPAVSKLVKKRRVMDQTEMMFTNSNASLCPKRHRV